MNKGLEEFLSIRHERRQDMVVGLPEDVKIPCGCPNFSINMNRHYFARCSQCRQIIYVISIGVAREKFESGRW